MAERICKNDFAALLNEVYSCLMAGFVFTDVVLVDDLILFKTASDPCCLDAFHMCVGITFVFIANEDNADLEVVLFFIGGAGAECKCHSKHERKSYKLFHLNFLRKKLYALKILSYCIITTKSATIKPSFCIIIYINADISF